MNWFRRKRRMHVRFFYRTGPTTSINWEVPVNGMTVKEMMQHIPDTDRGIGHPTTGEPDRIMSWLAEVEE